MHEIKFRAWDNIDKQMRVVSAIFGFNEGSRNHLDLVPAVRRRQQNCELMQYIGVKDKNSVEIYDGDIISDNVGIKAEVRYIQANASFMLLIEKVVEPQTIYAGQMRNCEVVGNIYENPELLT